MRSKVYGVKPGVLAVALALTAAHAMHGQTPSAADTKPAAANSTAPHFPTSEDLRHLKSLGAPQLSPNGKQILFSITESTVDGAATHLWLAPATDAGDGSTKPRQITFSPPADKHGERSAQWSADGAAIYFLAKRGEQTQIFRLDLRGGEAAPYDLKTLPPVDESKIPDAIPPPGAEDKKPEKKSDDKPAAKPADKKPDAPEPLPLDIGGFAPSPDGKWLAVWARDPETPGEKKQKEAKADASWVNHELHGTRLYLAALKPDGSLEEAQKEATPKDTMQKEGTPKDAALKLVAVEPDVHGVVWSPLSDRLIAVTEKPNDASDLGPDGAAWMVNVATIDKPVQLAGVPPTIGRGLAWRPDGGQIVFAAQTPEDAPPGYDELFALSTDSSSAARRLSAGFKGQLNGSVLFYTDKGSLVAEAAIGTHLAPVRIGVENAAAPTTIDLATSVVDGLNTNRNQTGWVWLANAGGQPEKLCYAAKLGDPCQPISTPDLAPANLKMVKPELVQWKSDKFTIEGLLYLPPDTTGKVPLVVDVHGGPFSAFEDRDDPFAAFLIGHGWAVLRPNPRGSSNYGVQFGAANKNDLGGGDYRDVMAGVDAVLAKYPLDSTRMALMGYSYGGEMAGFVEGKTDRFKAIISGAPVIDQFSEYGTEGGSWYDRWYFGKPWEHMDDAWRQSPLSGAAHAKTPFMLLQGESDTTDPLGQSQEMYRALRQEGVPVELVTYPRDNHSPLATGMFGRPSSEPWHGFDARQRLVEFIDKAFGTAIPTTGTKP